PCVTAWHDGRPGAACALVVTQLVQRSCPYAQYHTLGGSTHDPFDGHRNPAAISWSIARDQTPHPPRHWIPHDSLYVTDDSLLEYDLRTGESLLYLSGVHDSLCLRLRDQPAVRDSGLPDRFATPDLHLELPRNCRHLLLMQHLHPAESAA